MRTYVISSRLYVILLLICLCVLVSCGQSTSTNNAKPTPAVLDAYGTPITFPHNAPQRIVSLVPSTSEILGALHLQSKVVGVDNYTDYPADIAKLPKVSDATGKVNVEQVLHLKPDLVLSDGGLTKPYDGQLANLGLHVVDLPSADFEQSLQQIALVGRLTFTEDTAKSLVNQLQQEVAQIKAKVGGTIAPKVLLEADDSTAGKPYVFGGGSFGDQMLQDVQAINIFHNNSSNGGYPQVTDEAVISASPQFVILTEDLRYGGNPALVYKRINWGNIDAVKHNHVYHINTALMQRPGPRLVEGLRCLAQILHQDKFPGPLPDYC